MVGDGLADSPPPPLRACVCQAHAASLSKGKQGAPPARSQREIAQVRKDVALGRRVKRAPGPQPSPETTAHRASAARAAALAVKQHSAKLATSTSVWRHICTQLRPRSLPELLVAANRLDVDIFATPAMLWLIDAVVACEFLPVAWQQLTLRNHAEAAQSNTKEFLNKLTATERLRLVSHGEVTHYHNALVNGGTKQHPMAAAVKDAERVFLQPPSDGKPPKSVPGVVQGQ